MAFDRCYLRETLCRKNMKNSISLLSFDAYSFKVTPTARHIVLWLVVAWIEVPPRSSPP